MKNKMSSSKAAADEVRIQRRIRCGLVRASIAVLLAALTVLAVRGPGQVATAQSSPLRKSFALEERFAQHQRDFSDFSRSNENNQHEWLISSTLETIAERTLEYLDSTFTLLQVYENVSCSADRAKIRPLVKEQISRYAKRIEIDIPLLNANLAETKLPAIASDGDRMKQDLRDAKAFFESLQTSLE